MLKVGTKIVYPKYGAGKVTGITKEDMNGVSIEYYEIEFFDAQISIMIPTDKADDLGLKYNLDKKEIEGSLKNLGKKVKVTEEMLTNLDTLTKDKLKSGSMDDAVELVNIINTHAKMKAKDNKKISFTEGKNLESASNYIKSVVTHFLSKKELDKYNLV